MAEAEKKMELVDWLDDLSVRFIINLPKEELESSERICFQIEEAQWFYEDFIRPLDPTLPSMNLRKFCSLIFQHCPLLAEFSDYHAAAYSEFLAYKTRVPVRGAIMLNHAMDHIILVKGWKKGSKWSFPRGKINKDEKDIDCAVREVYEETGFDLREAGLIPPDEDNAKYIDVSLREQQMRLYVFRGVPMDANFEPKTRKEISKIQWYKLSDLPTLKKEKQLQQQAANGEDALKGSNFYMVAPFLGSLRKWIAQQRRQDKAKIRAVHPRGIVVEDEDTGAEADGVGEEPVPSDGLPEVTDTEDTTGHMARLLSALQSSKQGKRISSNLPEVSDFDSQAPNPAQELKRLLSVGDDEEEENPLLTLLRGQSAVPQAQEKMSVPPQSPLGKTTDTDTTPHYHYPRPPVLPSLPPPPRFPFPPAPGMAPLPLHPHGPKPLPPHQFPSSDGRYGQEEPPSHLPPHLPPHRAHLPHFNYPPPMHPPGPPPPQDFKPFEQPGDPLVAPSSLPLLPGLHSPAIPPASRLPPPKLTSHSLALLNALKSPHEQPPKQAPFQQRGLVPSTIRPSVKKPSTTSPTEKVAPQPPAESVIQPRQELPTAIPTQPKAMRNRRQPTTNAQAPAAAKPARSAHQDKLLNLFRAPSAPQTATGPQSQTQNTLAAPPEPVELSAYHSPHVSRDHSIPAVPKPPHPRLPALMTTNVKRSGSPGLTSATVSGPLNAPDFDTVRRHQKPTSATTATAPRAVELGNGITSPHLNKEPTTKPAQPPVQGKGWQPIILKRPQSQQPQQQQQQQQHQQQQQQQTPPAPAAERSTPQQLLPRKATMNAETRNTLLALFTKTSQQVASPAGTGIAPVSPLHDFAKLRAGEGEAPASLAGVVGAGEESRSRISSIASGNELGEAVRVGESRKGSLGGGSQISPVDRSFLLGYLENVVKGGTGTGR